MKLKNLIDEVYTLGFEDVANVGSLFYTCLLRGLRTIYTEYPREKSLRLILPRYEYTRIVKDRLHIAGACDEFNISGAAYSILVSGEGSITLTDESGRREFHFGGINVRHSGLLFGAGRLEFSGKLSYQIHEVITLPVIYTENIDEIPLIAGGTRLDMTKLVSDFMSFSRMPEDDCGRKIEGCEISGECMILPCECSGPIRLFYNSLPGDVIPDDPECEIDIPKQLEHLLALIIAAYMWLDDSPEHSTYYMSLYRDAMDRILAMGRHKDSSFTDVLGWA